MRGSFPKVTELVGAFGKANNRLLLVKTLKQKLMQYREELHEPVIHETAPQIPKAASNIKEYLCNVAGFCVHGANGRSIILMHTNVNRVLHARFSKKSGQSAVTHKAMVVLCAICEYDTTVTGDDGEELIQHTVVNKWCHLGVYMQKPRGFGCQFLTMQEHQDVVTVDSECGVVQLDLEFSYETAWDFCRFLINLEVGTFVSSSCLPILVCRLARSRPIHAQCKKCVQRSACHGLCAFGLDQLTARRRNKLKSDG